MPAVRIARCGPSRSIQSVVDIAVYEYRGVGIAELPLQAGTVYAVFSRVAANGRDRLSFPSLENVHSWLDRAVSIVAQHGTTLHECYFDAAELCEILNGA